MLIQFGKIFSFSTFWGESLGRVHKNIDDACSQIIEQREKNNGIGKGRRSVHKHECKTKSVLVPLLNCSFCMLVKRSLCEIKKIYSQIGKEEFSII